MMELERERERERERLPLYRMLGALCVQIDERSKPGRAEQILASVPVLLHPVLLAAQTLSVQRVALCD